MRRNCPDPLPAHGKRVRQQFRGLVLKASTRWQAPPSLAHCLAVRAQCVHKAARLLPANEYKPSKAVSYADPTRGDWSIQEYYTGEKSADGTISKGIAVVKLPDSTSPIFADFIKDERLQQLWITVPAYELILFNYRTKTRCSKATSFDNNALLQLIDANPAIIRKVKMDSRGNIWLIPWSDLLYRYQTQTNKLYVYSLASIQGKKSSSTSNNWVSTLL